MTGFAILGIIVFAIMVLIALGFLVVSLPDLKRYLRIQNM